jgi:hypothetical protein
MQFDPENIPTNLKATNGPMTPLFVLTVMDSTDTGIMHIETECRMWMSQLGYGTDFIDEAIAWAREKEN